MFNMFQEVPLKRILRRPKRRSQRKPWSSCSRWRPCFWCRRGQDPKTFVMTHGAALLEKGKEAVQKMMEAKTELKPDKSDKSEKKKKQDGKET